MSPVLKMSIMSRLTTVIWKYLYIQLCVVQEKEAVLVFSSLPPPHLLYAPASVWLLFLHLTLPNGMAALLTREIRCARAEKERGGGADH